MYNPRHSAPDYIRNEIETKYGEYGYGDLRSDVSEKTSGALKQRMALLSDKLDFKQVLEKAMKGGTDGCLITVRARWRRTRSCSADPARTATSGACSRRWSPRLPASSNAS